MASSRDDFIIAIRSAFLKKSTKQKFSLLTLALFSVLIISLSSFDFKIIRYLKIGIYNIIQEIISIINEDYSGGGFGLGWRKQARRKKNDLLNKFGRTAKQIARIKKRK